MGSCQHPSHLSSSCLSLCTVPPASLSPLCHPSLLCACMGGYTGLAVSRGGRAGSPWGQSLGVLDGMSLVGSLGGGGAGTDLGGRSLSM